MNWNEKRAINLDYFPIFAAIALLLGTIIDLKTYSDLKGLSLGFALKAMSYFAMALIIYSFAHLTQYLEIEKLTPASIALIGAVAGWIQGSSLYLMYEILDVEILYSFMTFASSGAIFVGLWLPAQSIAASNYAIFKGKLAALGDQALELKAIDSARQRLKITEEELIQRRINKMIQKTGKSASLLLENATSANSTAELSTIARSLATDHLRVLSHQILNLELNVKPRVYSRIFRRGEFGVFIETLKISLKTKYLSPEIFTLALLASIELPLIRRNDFPTNLYAIFMVCASTFLIQKSGQILRRRTSIHPVLLIALVTVLNCLASIAGLESIPNNVTQPGYQVALVLAILVITGIGLMAQTGQLRQDQLIEELSQAIKSARAESSRINGELALIARKWARHIHGNLQAKLHAYALVLEQAEAHHDSTRIEIAVEDIGRIIREIDQEIEAVQIGSLREALLSKTQLWEGLVEIELDLDPGLATKISEVNLKIAESIGEAIANAVRHGKASKIMISVRNDREFIRLVVSDNGEGLLLKEPGIGSRVFDAATAHAWSLKRDDENQRTLLTLTFTQ